MKSAVCTAFTIVLIVGMFWMSPLRSNSKPVQVEVRTCEQADIYNSITVRGKAEVVNKQRLFAPAAALVERVYVQQGQQVNKGDPLVTLTLTRDTSLLQQAAGASAERIIGALVDDAQDGQLEGENTELVARAASAMAPIPAQTPEQTVTIEAPEDGVVMDVLCTAGETVTPVLPCVTMADLTKMVVRAQIGEENLHSIAIGQEADISFEAFPDAKKNGRITSIAPYAKSSALLGQSADISTDVLIALSNSDSAIRPGYTATVKVKTERRNDALLLPYSCVGQDEKNREYVLVVKEGHARRQLVETGFELGDEVEITAGLTQEDLVICNPVVAPAGRRVQIEVAR